MWLNQSDWLFPRKSQKLLTEQSSMEAAYSEQSMAIRSVPAFVCFDLPAREASSFCDF